MPRLFTIGHSTHTLEAFVGLLRQHRIEAVADVRSNPYSARLPQFCREPLKAALRIAQIRYAFLGVELGARRDERECYVDGIARYDLIAKTPAFQDGLARVTRGIQQLNTALICAEKDPLECHRTILVCRNLRQVADINHILSDGTLEPHADAEARLMVEEKIPPEDFFATRDDLLARAYDQRAKKIAFQEDDEAAADSQTHA